MKIKTLEFENFRNFKNPGKIIFDTADGKVNIIYGRNGDGKTTLHQLFHWIFYGDVHFNKTTTDKMYNLEYEAEQQYNSEFSVIGKIDFSHNNEEYSLRREWVYKKAFDDSKKIRESFTLNKKTSENDWTRVQKPELLVEELLPSGLSQYFFFDGESMIADLKVKGKDSAEKLRKALYSMFDLEIYEQAIEAIGRTDLKTTALGSLYLEKANVTSSDASKTLKIKIEQVENKIQELEDKKNGIENRQKELNKLKEDLSEQIGTTKSRQEYEMRRKDYQKSGAMYLGQIDQKEADFGEIVNKSVPILFLSKRIESARKTMKMKVEEGKLLPGLKRELVEALLEENQCICGHTLTEENKEELKKLLLMLPPHSYKESYESFVKTAKLWGSEFDIKALESPEKEILQLQEEAANCDKQIAEIDKLLKQSKDIQDLIIDRNKAEEELKELSSKHVETSNEIYKYQIVLKKAMKDFDNASANESAGKEISAKIWLLENVKTLFENKLETASNEYSDKLREEIQQLINRMLTSKRSVSVSTDFFVKVFDHYGDESKSEGQFAVVSFAYIAGILKLLQEEETLEGKEYPLVLDGPFSKLDPDQRQNVIDTIPEYAPQIILFSKETLAPYFDENKVGRVWTLQSNNEKNVTEVKEGCLWK